RPTAPAPPYTLSLHDALPISRLKIECRKACGFESHLRHVTTAQRTPKGKWRNFGSASALHAEGCGFESRLLHLARRIGPRSLSRSEEHTSELQSRENLVCRLL